jgi:hypothetical protein
MARLAEYMADLARLLGTQEHVHFVGIEEGSLVLLQEIEYEAVPKIRDRINGIKHHNAPADAIAAYEQIDRRLKEDNGTAFLEAVEDRSIARVIEFPGRDREALQKFEPIHQSGTLDGVLIRVGGRDETVPVYLEEGNTIHKCSANRAMAKKLAAHLFVGTLRVTGIGKWNRDDFGNWVFERFTINDFEVLNDTGLKEAVKDLRDIESPFRSIDDPVGELHKLRHDPR